MEYIESQFEEEEKDGDGPKLWELKLNKDEVKVYIKKGGSHVNKD